MHPRIKKLIFIVTFMKWALLCVLLRKEAGHHGNRPSRVSQLKPRAD
jgi:hypothetical protein